MIKIMIYPISNWSKYKDYISGAASIVYKNTKYQIAIIGYTNGTIKFTLLSPDKLNNDLIQLKEKESFMHQKYILLDPNNYWDGCVAFAEFNIINLYDDSYIENRDFFTDDIKHIRDNYSSNFKRKFTNENIYILKDNYYCAEYEFGEDKDKILGIFIKKICKNFAYYLRLLHSIYNDDKLIASIYDNKSHKYLTDVFIALRHGYEKDPETMTDDEYEEIDKALENKFIDMGFVSINDYTGFKGSHGFVFNNPTTNKELIYLYKSLYSYMCDEFGNFKA